ncbi:hypothetical protein [Calothrix sp. NIES-2100]
MTKVLPSTIIMCLSELPTFLKYNGIRAGVEVVAIAIALITQACHL